MDAGTRRSEWPPRIAAEPLGLPGFVPAHYGDDLVFQAVITAAALREHGSVRLPHLRTRVDRLLRVNAVPQGHVRQRQTGALRQEPRPQMQILGVPPALLITSEIERDVTSQQDTALHDEVLGEEQ